MRSLWMASLWDPWPAILAALIPAEAPRPYCFAGIGDLSAQAVEAGLRAGMDEFYVAGTEASIVFRATLWARKGVYAAVAEAAAQRIEQANDVIYTIDFEGRFTSANAAAERLTGVPREQLMGKHLSELLPGVRGARDGPCQLQARRRVAVLRL